MRWSSNPAAAATVVSAHQICLASAAGGHRAALLMPNMHLPLLPLTADLTAALTAALTADFVVDRYECGQPADLATAAAVGPCCEASAGCSLHSAAHAVHVTL